MARHRTTSGSQASPNECCAVPATSAFHNFAPLCATFLRNVRTTVIYSAGWRRRCAQWLECCQRCTVTARPLQTAGHGLVYTMGLSRWQWQCTDRPAGDTSAVQHHAGCGHCADKQAHCDFLCSMRASSFAATHRSSSAEYRYSRGAGSFSSSSRCLQVPSTCSVLTDGDVGLADTHQLQRSLLQCAKTYVHR